MGTQNLFQLIVKPHTTEKSTLIAEKNRQITFKVAKDANKSSIKEAIEKIFSVSVDKVRVANIKGKVRNFHKIAGRTKTWKKAIVTLSEGHDINLAEYE